VVVGGVVAEGVGGAGEGGQAAAAATEGRSGATTIDAIRNMRVSVNHSRTMAVGNEFI